MAAIDVVLLVVLAASVLIGAWRGLVYEAIALLGWGAAFVLAQRWGLQVAQQLPMHDWGEPLRYAAGFALVFVGVVLAAGLLAWLAQRGAAALGLRPVDRLLGAAFGALRAVVLLLAVALLVHQTPLAYAAAWQASVGARWLAAALAALRTLVPADVAVYFP
ncbi:CvpA family protein [Tepidimonas aquatica]|uniref:Colicin V production protein n=1 Tax=Tepidimonas aquatica TaxID=247482 RepID=A0A554WU84_9BURK|nr:CvpA family protein [Tepidimonas aquatica]TSE27148.1 Colicin V production protein [Tepidimonas aquatica]